MRLAMQCSILTPNYLTEVFFLLFPLHEETNILPMVYVNSNYSQKHTPNLLSVVIAGAENVTHT